VTGMEVLAGTPAGQLLASQLDALLQHWKNRNQQPELKDWVGFGVSLSATPRIVYFFAGGVAPPPDALGLDIGDPDNAPGFFTGVLLQSIPPAYRHVPFGPLRNAQPGDNIDGRAHGGAVSEGGTLAAFLVEAGVAGPKWAMSANHVIAFNNQYADLTVNIPGTDLAVDNPSGVPIVQNLANLADVAIVSCTNPDAISAPIPGLPIATITPAASPAPSTSVRKVGWTTSSQIAGQLSYFAARIQVTPDSFQTLGVDPCEFASQWMVQGPINGFAAPGDSGALVVAQLPGGNQPLGMLIAVQAPGQAAAQDVLSVVTPLPNILSALNTTTGKTFELDPDMVGTLRKTR
jgi:hypothetical protein